MPLPEFDEHATDAYDRFRKHLPLGADASLVILKLHLLVEEQIRAFVDERLPNASALEAARLEYNQIICLAEAISTEDISPSVWEAARRLNTLRNQIAHNLEPHGVIDRMVHISALLGLPYDMRDIEGRTVAESALDNLIFTVLSLHTELALFVKKRSAMVLTLVNDDDKA